MLAVILTLLSSLSLLILGATALNTIRAVWIKGCSAKCINWKNEFYSRSEAESSRENKRRKCHPD